MLGLRLDQPLRLDDLWPLIDTAQLDRMEHAGMLARQDDEIVLCDRGRFLANDVVSTLLR